MSPIAQVWGVLRKDLLVEWRARARTMALSSFALTVLLLFSFAVGPDTETLRQHCGAYLWLSLLFSSTLLLAHSMQTEVESGALESLILAPVSPAALFYGKALANTLQLMFVAAVALPIGFALTDASLRESAWMLLASIALGSAGLAAPGTLYAGMTARLPSRQLLLPLLMFPLIVPCLLAAVKSTSLLIGGDPMAQVPSWLALLACFDLVYWSLCGVLFGKVLDA